MIRGHVNRNYKAVLPLVVWQGERLKSINAVIDTGFTGFLSLPLAMVQELNLVRSYSELATLGDGSEVLFDIYGASVIWDGQYREIEINAAETEPLLGMRLLRSHQLQINAVEGGLVTIQSSTT